MDNLGDGLERGFDENDDEQQKQITKVKEGLYPSGLYFKEEDGSQGIAPRSQDSNAFKLSDEEMSKKELLARRLIDAHPQVSQGVIDFACSFWVKHPEEFKKIIQESKGTESKSIEQIEKMKEKYGMPEEEKFQSTLFNMEQFFKNNNDDITFSQISV